MNKKELIKILYICPNGFLGGAEKVVLELANGHLKKKHFLPIILFLKNGEAVEEAKKRGIDHYLLKNSFKLTQPIKLLNAIQEIRDLIVKRQIKLIHHTMAYGQIIGSLASWNLNLKTIWFQHGPVGGFLDKMASLFHTDLLLFNSQFLKKQHHLSFPHTRISFEQVLPVGIDVPSETKEKFKKNELTFGAAGRICRGKGFKEIISLFDRFESIPFQILIAGKANSEEDKQYEIELINLIENSKIKNKVKLAGHIDDMSEFYNEVDVFIHASLNPEPFGLVMAEAMSHGCLVIGKAGGGSDDYLKNEVTGFSFETYDQLKDILTSIITSDQKSNFKKITKAGQEFITKNYNKKKMMENLENLYHGIL